MNKNKFLIKSYKQMFMVIGIFTLVLLVGGTTYAFFNYTRTGRANTLNTGRIYFSTEQTNQNTITLNNIFPMTKEQALADSSTNGTLVVTFNGDTEYTDGMEYLLSIDSVTGTTNVPISLIMDVNITENNVALTDNPNYYTAREAKNTSMYKAEGTDTTINSTTHKVITDIETGKYLLAGYIKSGQYGVNGTVTIKAFIDADNILITDTPNDQSQRPSTAYTDGTDTTGKTVISTTDWNSLQTNGISFKVKGEAREGIWVEEQLSRNDMKKFPTEITGVSSTITEINFIRMGEEEINNHTNLIDLTADNGKGVVKGWIDNNKLYIASPGETYFPEDSSHLFQLFSNVININFDNINTENVYDMQYMFNSCKNVQYLDLKKFNTSNVTDMTLMFFGCTDITYIDLSSFDTRSLQSAKAVTMFGNCTNLTTIYVGNNWDVSTQPSGMPLFDGCTSLVGGNGTTFDSSKVDKTMAVVDTVSTPGYLTLKQS